MSYPGHSLGGVSYPSAEVQSVYSTALADWATSIWTEIEHFGSPEIYEKIKIQLAQIKRNS